MPSELTSLNETHDPQRSSWVLSANDTQGDFPIQNLPFGVFRRRASTESFRGGVAIGDQILDMAHAVTTGAFSEEHVGPAVAQAAALAARPTLNGLMALGPEASSTLRLALSRALRDGSTQQSKLQPCLVPQAAAEYELPATIGDYTDFFTSIHHATAVGRLFRPDNPLLPNYRWLPIGYHGRASSIVISGTDVHRPIGQTLPGGAATPLLGPSKRLDYELEIGVFIGRGNTLGSRIDIANAESHIFGVCLLNDWSARDLQSWEYQPLGPFLAKNFASTISPWVVTVEALAPHRLPWQRPSQDPAPLAYLDAPAVRARGAVDMQVEVYLQSESMRRAGYPPARLSASNFRHSYWTMSQMIAHHTVNGCNLQPGDLLGSGTQSGPSPDEAGSLLELSRGGHEPLLLPNGEARRFLEDGDEVILRAYCERPGAARIGLGYASGRVLSARD